MRDRIIQLINKYTKGRGTPAPGESLFDGGYLDSWALPDLVGDLEREFQIAIPDSDLNPRKFETVDRIVDYVAGKQ